MSSIDDLHKYIIRLEEQLDDIYNQVDDLKNNRSGLHREIDFGMLIAVLERARSGLDKKPRYRKDKFEYMSDEISYHSQADIDIIDFAINNLREFCKSIQVSNEIDHVPYRARDYKVVRGKM